MLKKAAKKWKTVLFKHKKWAIGGAVLLGAGAMALQGAAPVAVTARTAENGTVQKLIEATATVESLTSRTLQGHVSGEVTEILKDTGDTVKAGDVLAVADVTDISLTLKALEAQQASLRALMNEVDKPTAEALRQAEARMVSDSVALGAARRGLEQARALQSAGAGSEEGLRSAEEALLQAEQTAIISEAAYRSLKNGLTVHQRARYEADIAALQAQIDQVLTDRSRYQIKSPVDGIITRREVRQGQLLTPGTVLYEVEDPSRLRLSAEILVQDAARIRTGAPVNARDEEAGLALRGTVTRIEPKAFSKLSDLGIEQKRVRIEITPDAFPEGLRIGMELDMEAVEAQADDVLMLPDSAVFELDGAPHVFRIAGGRAVLTAITTGLEGQDAVEVTGGLKPGDQVVDAPGNDLADGARVKVQ